jgi:hypothetical protein
MTDAYLENEGVLHRSAMAWLAKHNGYEELVADDFALGDRMDSAGRIGDRAVVIEVKTVFSRNAGAIGTVTGHSFHGCRLSPNLWRAIGRAYGNDGSQICVLTPAQLEVGQQIIQKDAADHHLKVPRLDILQALISALGPQKLQKILDRHLDTSRSDRYGTPDLFLFARESGKDRVAFYRLVEVKKPKERISADQHEEIEFLRFIGIPARILRLIERA